jgi:peptide/nickel transport system substrate-binding protein
MNSHSYQPSPGGNRPGGSMRSGRGNLRLLRWRAWAVLAAALVLAACSSTPPASTRGKPLQGGIATYALPVGDEFAFLGRFANAANCNVFEFSPSAGSWRALYYAGVPGGTGIDYRLSLAYPPRYFDGGRKVTVTLHRGYMWSDGVPVTTADVRFYFEILRQHPLCISFDDLLPKDVKSITYNGLYSFTLTLNRPYSPLWFTENQLEWINPLPAHAWDKTCLACKVGNYAATPAGAKKVADFLMGQFEKLSTYATNPLWKVVDGPWVIHSFSPVTYETTWYRNPHYTGPQKPHLAGYTIMSFASPLAEIDALRSGVVDFGYLEPNDYGQIGYFRSHGFSVVPWPQFANDAVEYGYTNPTYGPLVRQLYIRQALQHLVNEEQDIKVALHGFGQPDYGNVAVLAHSDLISPELRHPIYPYSIKAAQALLAAHGWKRGPGGVAYCARPGTGPGECGPGIPAGKTLSLMFVYQSGVPSTEAEVEAFATDAAKAGVHILLHPESPSTEATEGECPPGPCNYGLLAYAGELWTYGYDDGVPEASQEFGPGAFYGGGYSSAEADRLFNAVKETPTTSLTPLYQMEDFLAKDCAGLWLPVTEPITVVSSRLRGWYPLLPNTVYEPSRWYFVKG